MAGDSAHPRYPGQVVAQVVADFGSKSAKCWSEWQDLNLRPPRPERGALPDCATLRLLGRMVLIATPPWIRKIISLAQRISGGVADSGEPPGRGSPLRTEASPWLVRSREIGRGIGPDGYSEPVAGRSKPALSRSRPCVLRGRRQGR
jgi:hypothetical protein